MRGETEDTNDDVTTKTNTVHMKRDTWQVNVHVVFLLVLFSLASSSSLIAHHIWLKLCACLISSMHEAGVTLRPWALHSIQLPLLLIHLQFPAAPPALLLPRGQVVTLCTPPTRRWGLRTNPTSQHLGYRRLLQAQHVESFIRIALPRAREWYCRISWTLTWPWSHSLVTLLLIYSFTRSECSPLHDDTLDTIVHGVSSWYGTIASGWEMIPKFRRFQEVGSAFSYIVFRNWVFQFAWSPLLSSSSWAACSADASKASRFSIMARRNSSRSRGEQTNTPQATVICLFHAWAPGRRDRLPCASWSRSDVFSHRR